MTTHMKTGKKMTLEQHASMPASKAHGKGRKKFSQGGLNRMNMERKAVGRNMAKVMAQRGR